MKTFKNKNFKKRDYECTNIIFCQSENKPLDIWGMCWVECDELEIEIEDCDQLYTENGVRYFGYL